MKTSTDIWFCSFLIRNGHPIASFDVIAKGRVRCAFAVSDETWKALKLAFHASELAAYKQLIDQLKDLSY